MSKDHEEIHVGDALRKAMDGRKEPLSSVINLIVERYSGLIERAGKTPMMGYHADLYCNVLREAGHPLSSQEIAVFPLTCEDWLRRHPKFPQEPGKTAVMILKNSPFVDLLALVDMLEREL